MRHKSDGEQDAAGHGKKKDELGSTDYYGGTGAGGFPPGGTNKDDLPIEDPAAGTDKPVATGAGRAGKTEAPVQDVPGGTLNDPDNEPEHQDEHDAERDARGGSGGR